MAHLHRFNKACLKNKLKNKIKRGGGGGGVERGKSGMGSPDWNVSIMVDIHLRKLLCVYFPWVYFLGYAGVKGNDRADTLAGEATLTSGLLLGRSEALRNLTLPTGTKPRTSHYRSPGDERRGKKQRWTIFLERTRERHHQSNEHWNCFKGNVGETT